MKERIEEIILELRYDLRQDISLHAEGLSDKPKTMKDKLRKEFGRGFYSGQISILREVIGLLSEF